MLCLFSNMCCWQPQSQWHYLHTPPSMPATYLTQTLPQLSLQAHSVLRYSWLKKSQNPTATMGCLPGGLTVNTPRLTQGPTPAGRASAAALTWQGILMPACFPGIGFLHRLTHTNQRWVLGGEEVTPGRASRQVGPETSFPSPKLG